MSYRRSLKPSERRAGGGGRVHKRGDYRRCYEQGRRRHGAWCTVFVVANELGRSRLGITVTRKVGAAVVRNRVKRRLREIYRRWDERTKLPAVDIVVHAKPQAREASYVELRTEVERFLRSILNGGSESWGRAATAALVGYKRWLSPLLPRACRFSPTCSEYARLAILKYGVWRGGLKATLRLFKCQPFHAGGIDLP